MLLSEQIEEVLCNAETHRPVTDNGKILGKDVLLLSEQIEEVLRNAQNHTGHRRRQDLSGDVKTESIYSTDLIEKLF